MRDFDPARFNWPDVPCRNNHVAPRYRSNGACYECQKMRRARYREGEVGAETERRGRKRWYEKHRTAEVERASAARTKKPQYAATASRRWRERNPEAVKNYAATYSRSNSAVKAKLAAAYTARKLRATPAWADSSAIAEVYRIAARLTNKTGVPHEVDHIIPLRGKTVCGLHVHYNLRAIPARDNRRKYNHLKEDMQCPTLKIP